MFDLDKWQEIFSTIQKNKLRTFLTGFSVAWGIFMLVILLGSGKGIENGVSDGFKDDATNSLWISGGRTAIPYKGLKAGRRIQFTNEDYDYIKDQIEGTEHVTNRYALWGKTVSFGANSGSYGIRSTTPEHQILERTIMSNGRYLNSDDISERRKVAVIGKLVKEDLFKSQDPIGQYVSISGFSFKVIGVFKDDGNEREMRMIYIPISTGQMVFNGKQNLGRIMTTIGDADLMESYVISSNIARYFSQKYSFHPRDARAIYIGNNVEEFQKYQVMFGNIRIFIWFVGLGTILAGIVGISNIMLIVVKERTREIGIRKALGASPNSIISLVLTEAVFITGIAGYIGLVLGVSLLEFLSSNLQGVEMFKNPEIDFSVAISATVLLIISGIIAGYIPAKRASSIEPVVALRED